MRDFATLFKGREDAHGHYFSLAGRKKTDRGKVASKAESVHEPVTPALFKDHLAGKFRLGIIPVRSDGTVGWFCIDLDWYELSGGKTLEESGGYVKIAEAISACVLPLIITRSKSGGAHLWCFLHDPIDADDAAKIAESFLKKLNLPSILGINAKEFYDHVDIFPINGSKDDIAIWVNLPYFGDACHCVGEDGTGDLPLPEFVKLANAHLATPGDLKFKRTEKVKAKAPKSDRPPCIDFMFENGVPEGHRNECVTQFAIYAQRAFPDDWEEKTREFNDEVCDPPMRHDEVTPILKSVGTREYQYMCKAMQSIYCNKSECKKRAFGVGKEAVGDLGIEHIEKIDGEKPIYLVTIEGKTFDCDVEGLFRYGSFRLRAVSALNRILPNMKQPEWEDMLSDMLEMMEVTEAGSDTQMRDRVISQFKNWCSQSCVTDDFDAAMEANCPFYDGKRILFSGDALLSQLDRQLRISRDDAYVHMRNWGTIMVTEHGRKLWCWVQKEPLWFDAHKGKRK